MEQVTIWKSSLEGIMSDLERAGLVCADVAEGINGLANSASDEDPICDRLYSLGRVLGLLRENLDSNHDYLSEWVRDSEKYIARASRPAGTTPVPPPSVTSMMCRRWISCGNSSGKSASSRRPE